MKHYTYCSQEGPHRTETLHMSAVWKGFQSGLILTQAPEGPYWGVALNLQNLL